LFEQFIFSASLTVDFTAKQWDKSSSQLIRTFPSEAHDQVTAIAISENGQFLFMGGRVGIDFAVSYLTQWRISDGTKIKDFLGFMSSIKV
jgi:WD40 repeat protein